MQNSNEKISINIRKKSLNDSIDVTTAKSPSSPNRVTISKPRIQMKEKFVRVKRNNGKGNGPKSVKS